MMNYTEFGNLNFMIENMVNNKVIDHAEVSYGCPTTKFIYKNKLVTIDQVHDSYEKDLKKLEKMAGKSINDVRVEYWSNMVA